jgi:hypothetical protein
MRLENLLGLLVLLTLATAAGAQQQKSPPVKAGVVSGSVFAITKGGDLKPARMAKIYLFYASQAAAESGETGTAGTAWRSNLHIAMDKYDREQADAKEHPKGYGVWQPNQPYKGGEIIIHNGYAYMAMSAGSTGDAPPVFATDKYSHPFHDGTMTWMYTGSASELAPGESEMCPIRLAMYRDVIFQTLQEASSTHKESQAIVADADEYGMFHVVVSHPGKYVILAVGRAGVNDAFWESDDIVVNAGATTTVKLSSPVEACVTD